MAKSRLAIILFGVMGFISPLGCRGSSPEARVSATIDGPADPTQKWKSVSVPGQDRPDVPDRAADGQDSLRAAADKAVRDMELPEGTWRFQNHADTLDCFQGGRRVLVSRSFLYRRILDGVPVYGPGTNIQVTVDPAGQVTSKLADWPLSIRRRSGVEAFSHLDLDQVISRELKPEEVPKGSRVINLGLCYQSQVGPEGLEAVPGVGVRVVPETMGGQGMGWQLFIPLKP